MDLEKANKYLRLANYIAAAQLYLKDNFTLERELSRDDIKKRILGHWGTVPGLNLIYLNLNSLIQKYSNKIMFIIGPGHGYPALLANLYIEGTFGDFYPEYKWSKEAFGNLIKNFSWPGGFPSHSNPETPGVILEGGELGYSLATAFGAAYDNPDLIVSCVVGDGESETGPTATAWHSNKFLNPITDGAVLPIVHLNKYKISVPTIYGTMNDEELTNLFSGYGYHPIIIQEEGFIEESFKAFDQAYNEIKAIQNAARSGQRVDRPKWPMIIFRNKKGWSGPKELKGKMVEDSFRSHGIPLEHPVEDEEEFNLLKTWLESYSVKELLDENFAPIQDIKDLVPQDELKIGKNKNANNFNEYKLNLPDLKTYEVPREGQFSSLNELGKYLRDIIKTNATNFRIFSPDESESNKLYSLFEVTGRTYQWPVPEGSNNMKTDGRIMEMLSEHTLQGWMEGYTLTGRHGILISYEAFLMIIASMVDQYSKFLKQSKHISWRKPLPSLNFILTSTSWRQDHNGYSHQNPGFISSSLNDYSNNTVISFPPDANSMLATMEEALQSTNRINVIVAGKTPFNQYLSLEDARAQVKEGVMWWKGIGNNDENPDIVFTACGDYATVESIAAIRMLKKIIPEMATRFVSVSELTCFGIGDNKNLNKMTTESFNEMFTADKKIIFTYHGYPEDIKALIFNHPAAPRFEIGGYVEKGSTTTPFDMQVLNGVSRIQLAISALNSQQGKGKLPEEKITESLNYLNNMLVKHAAYIKETGEDIDEIINFDNYF